MLPVIVSLLSYTKIYQHHHPLHAKTVSSERLIYIKKPLVNLSFTSQHQNVFI